jgi:hypothetical protein
MDQFKSAPEMYCSDFPGKDPTKDPDLGPVSYISCADDRTIRPVWWENAAREGWEWRLFAFKPDTCRMFHGHLNWQTF